MDKITYNDLSKTAQNRVYRAYKSINAAIGYLKYRGVTKELYKEEIVLLDQARDGIINKDPKEAEE